MVCSSLKSFLVNPPSINFSNTQFNVCLSWLFTQFCSLVAKSCLTLCDPMYYSSPGSSCLWDFPGKNTGFFHFLLQGIFLTQGSKPHLLHWQVDYLWLSHLGSILLPFARPGKHQLSSLCSVCPARDNPFIPHSIPMIKRYYELHFIADEIDA